jgi:hypothetical protein
MVYFGCKFKYKNFSLLYKIKFLSNCKVSIFILPKSSESENEQRLYVNIVHKICELFCAGEIAMKIHRLCKEITESIARNNFVLMFISIKKLLCV